MESFFIDETDKSSSLPSLTVTTAVDDPERKRIERLLQNSKRSPFGSKRSSTLLLSTEPQSPVNGSHGASGASGGTGSGFLAPEEIESPREREALHSPMTDVLSILSKGLLCSGCRMVISGNCISDEENHPWHSECFQLRRQFEEEEEEEDSEEDEDANFDDINRIVVYWRTLYFNKSEECDYQRDEKERLESKLSELTNKIDYMSRKTAAPSEEQVSLREQNEKLMSQLAQSQNELRLISASQAEAARKFESARVSKIHAPPSNEVPAQEQNEYEEMLEKELYKLQAQYDALQRTSTMARIEKDEKILELESEVESLRSKVSQMKVISSRESMEAREREAEFKKLQMKVAKIVQMFEEQKHQESDELAELKKRNEELTLALKQARDESVRIPKQNGSLSIEGLSLIELQTKYEDLKKNYDAQIAALKGTNMERVISKKKLDKEKKMKEAEAAAVRQGAMQYRVLIGVDGKRQKSKDWLNCWAVLNNQFLEFYPNQEARFTKKKVRLDLSGATVEYDKETKKKKDSGAALRLTTETHGCYQLMVNALEDSEEWFKAIQQICAANINSAMEEIAAGIARKSHCIPHRFKEAFYTISSTKCKFCNTMIHGRGFKCIHCQYSCHEKCSTRVPPNCGLTDSPKLGSVRDHPRKPSFIKQSSSMLNILRIGVPLTPDGSSPTTHAMDMFEVDLASVPGGDDEVPLVVSLCISAIERKGGMEMEGIYRIPGIKGEIEKLRMHFSYGRPNLDDEEWSDINVIGGVLKLWFRLLPGSLLTQQLFYEFTSTTDAAKPLEQRLSEMKGVMAKLPKRNYLILKHLIAHLARVAERGAVNKMHADNLGAVFGPSLMRSPKENDFASIGLQGAVIEFMIKHYHECFESS